MVHGKNPTSSGRQGEGGEEEKRKRTGEVVLCLGVLNNAGDFLEQKTSKRIAVLIFFLSVLCQ